jgi:3-methylcrotonyl-CoA carboxylase alpha subunit
VKKTELVQEVSEEAEKKDNVRSPMPGTVVKVFTKEGAQVKAGDPLVSIESMKMEYLIKATHDCTVAKVDVTAGQFVNMRDRLVLFK